MSIVESVVSSIDKKLQVFSSAPDPFGGCIYDGFRKLPYRNNYNPQILAIGPYHERGLMEVHKTRYFQMLLRRRNEDSSRRYVEAIVKIIDKASSYYESQGHFISSAAGIEMLVLDGCFVIEVIRKSSMGELRNLDTDDSIFKSEMFLNRIKHDLLLLKNQLPYFLLQILFDMTVMPNDEEHNFLKMIERFFDVLPGPGYRSPEEIPPQQIKHLLGFIHDNWLPSPLGLSNYMGLEEKNTSILCATKLNDAHVKFKKRLTHDGSLFDIKFEKGVLYIPQLNVDRSTESLFCDFIAYEQLSNQKSPPDHVLHYSMFMHSLIKTSKDVKLLSEKGIIINWLGDDEAVAPIFSRICEKAIPRHKFYYSEVCEKMQQHCGLMRNNWTLSDSTAISKHEYFKSPWAFISIVAAFVLLVSVFKNY